MGDRLKSLAHPDWPYAGTPHEWRGFVKSENARPLKDVPFTELAKMLETVGDKMRQEHSPAEILAIYQKQNFGKLD